MSARTHRPGRQRGSALGAAMILTMAVGLLLAALCKWAGTERDLTARHVARAKTQAAAEGVDQFGAAQIKARLDRLVYFADDEFRPGNGAEAPKVSSLVRELLASGERGIGPLLKDLKRSGAGSNADEAVATVSTAADGYFRYEITPDNLVIGRFSPARWERAEAGNPLYIGDPLIDQTIRVREVRMVSAAKAVHRERQHTIHAYCESHLQVRDSPVWGNVLFYNMDLEIAPGATMEVHGPVHTNGNLYVQSERSLQFHGRVTAAGRLYHGRVSGSFADGVVLFKVGGASDACAGLQQDGTWLDSRSDDWAARASTRWAGHLRTREHGINPAIPAGIPPYVPDDPATPANEWQNPAHTLIEPALENNASAYPGEAIEMQKFAAKACLVFEVTAPGVVSLYKYERSNSGRYLRDTGPGAQKHVRKQLNVPAGLVVGGEAADRFYDKRRGQWVRSLDLDVGRLKALIEQPGAAADFKRGGTSFDPATEWNGIVYVAHEHASRGGVRLVNGRAVPHRPTQANGNTPGFTLATDAPLYVLGHYNADGAIASDGARIREPDSFSEPPAGLAADAITILSSGWSDADSDRDLRTRKAQQTEIAAALLTGIVPTNKSGNGAYSGGVENLPRLLESWTGVTLGYRGSMVVLYESQRATEPWGSSNVYEAPDRVWGFNTLFAEGILPPGTPTARSYRRVGFRDLTAAQYEAALAAISQD